MGRWESTFGNIDIRRLLERRTKTSKLVEVNYYLTFAVDETAEMEERVLNFVDLILKSFAVASFDIVVGNRLRLSRYQIFNLSGGKYF